MEQLGSKAASSSIWMFSMRLLQQGLGLLQLVILGRLLTPHDFGLMGIASLAAQAIAVFVYTGYEYALVQKMDLEEIDIDTAWWVILGRRAFIGLTLMILAWPIAWAYQESSVVPILIVMGSIQIFSGFGTPIVSLMQRQMAYPKIFTFYLLSTLATLVIGVLAAYHLRNVWALVIATGVSTGMQVLLSYLMHLYRPKWRFSRASLSQLSNYGRWMLGSAILWFFYSQGATAFSGLIFSVAALGLYQMANRFATLPSSLFGETLLASFFPIYANLQQSMERVRIGFLKVLQLSSLIIFVSTILVAFGFPAFFVFFLGDQWVEISTLIAPIAFAGGVMALLRTGSPLFLGTGMPRHQFYLDLVQTLVMLILIYPFGNWFGLIGLPYAMITGSIFAFLVWWRGLRLSLNLTMPDLSKAFFSSGLSSVVLLCGLLVAKVPEVIIPVTGVSLLYKVLMIGVAIVFSMGAYLIAERIVPGYLQSTELWKLSIDQVRRFWNRKVLASTEG